MKKAKEELKEQIVAKISQSLDSTFWYCDRVWVAWGYGTMTQDDFYPANESDDMLDELADELLELFKSDGESNEKS